MFLYGCPWDGVNECTYFMIRANTIDISSNIEVYIMVVVLLSCFNHKFIDTFDRGQYPTLWPSHSVEFYAKILIM